MFFLTFLRNLFSGLSGDDVVPLDSEAKEAVTRIVTIDGKTYKKVERVRRSVDFDNERILTEPTGDGPPRVEVEDL